MINIFPDWLTKPMLRGVRGYNLDGYLIALEGWRRGLELTWYKDLSEVSDLKLIGFNPLGKSFSLFCKKTGKRHYFYRSRGDKVSNLSVDIVHDKHLAKKKLTKANVPTPRGITFQRSTENIEVIKLIEKQGLNYPLVLKPVYGSLGKGVVTNLQNNDELSSGLKYVKENFDYDEWIIEEHIEGDDYRVYVIDDQVVAATKRIPANIIGDGILSIKELIEKKNSVRKKNLDLSHKLIKINDGTIKYLSKYNLTLESIPEKNKTVRLSGSANIANGGDSIDITDDLDENIKD